MKIKILTLVLALIMLLSVFAACNSSNESTDTSKGTTSGSTDNQPQKQLDQYGREYIEDTVPADLQFKGKTVTFFTRSDNNYNKIEMDTEATTSDTLNDAIFYRNATVEKRLGITIDQVSQPGGWGSHTEWLQALRNTVLTRSGDYDAAAIYASQGSALATEGMYYNVKNVEYLNLEKPWWNQSLLEDLEIFDTLYFLGGDIAISQTSRAGLIVFNKDLFNEYYNNVNIYEIVDNKQWTIDKLYDLSSSAYRDSNNSGITDDGDQVGFTDFGGDGWLDIWIAALGVDITVKEDGYPALAIYNERTIDAFDKLKKLNYSNPGAMPFNATRDQTSFSKENVLFASTHLEACEGYRNMQAKYGALPMPMYDTDQDGYATYPQNGCSLITVLSSCSNTELVGATLELMAAEAYRQVTPEYYQVCLKGKYSADADDARMYDLVISGIKLDFGFIYGTQSIGGVNQLFRKLDGDIAQIYSSNKIKYEESLDDLITKLDDLSWSMMG